MFIHHLDVIVSYLHNKKAGEEIKNFYLLIKI